VPNFDYDKIRIGNMRVRKMYRLQPKTVPNYQPTWTSAMEGGGVLTDAEHWHQRYQDLTQEVIGLRLEIEKLQNYIKNLHK